MSVTTKQIHLGVGDRNISLTQAEGARGAIVVLVSGWEFGKPTKAIEALAYEGKRVLTLDGPMQRQCLHSGRIANLGAIHVGSLQLAAELLAHSGKERVATHVVGVSVGASVATDFVTETQSGRRGRLDVRSLTLVAPFNTLRTSALGKAKRLQAYPRLLSSLPLRVRHGWENFVKDGEFESTCEVVELLRTYADFPVRVLAGLAAFGETTLRALPKVAVPTTIFEATHDLLTAPLPQQLLDRCKNVRVQQIESGHFALLDWQRNTVVRHLRTVTS